MKDQLEKWPEWQRRIFAATHTDQVQRKPRGNFVRQALSGQNVQAGSGPLERINAMASTARFIDAQSDGMSPIGDKPNRSCFLRAMDFLLFRNKRKHETQTSKPMTTRIRVKRPVMIEGQSYDPGAIVTVPDSLIPTLRASTRCEIIDGEGNVIPPPTMRVAPKGGGPGFFA